VGAMKLALEHLLRYLRRPPLALKRLADGEHAVRQGRGVMDVHVQPG
jgi:hypothetical protein